MPPVSTRFAALLALSEVAFGSVLHALSVPFGGHVLSLNQGVLLTLASRHGGSRAEVAGRANQISLIGALFKALSPAGKRLTPMLAISVQGGLYAAGIFVAGPNGAGVALAMTWLALWGFVQPVLVAYLLFGKALFAGLQKIWLELAAVLHVPGEIEWWILGAVVVFKIALAIGAGLVAWSRQGFEGEYERTIREWSEKCPRPQLAADSRPKWRLVLRDLTTTWFLLALAFQAFFFFYSGQRDAQAVWTYFLRPLAVGAIFFWAMRSVPPSFWRKYLPA